MIKSVNTIQKLSLGQYGKNQSNTDIFHIGLIPVSPITARSELAKALDISIFARKVPKDIGLVN